MEDVERNKRIQRTFFIYYSRRLKKDHKFPTVKDAKRYTGIPNNRNLEKFGIKLKSVKTNVIRRRISEIFAEYPDISARKLNGELGINTRNWLGELGRKSYSDLKIHYTGRANIKKQRVFESREKAIRTIENFYFEYLMENKKLPPIDYAQSELKIGIVSYAKPEDVKRLKARVIERRLKKILRDNREIKKYELETELGIDIDNWVKRLGYESYPSMVKAYREEIVNDENDAKERFVNAINQGTTFEEKEKILSEYSCLIIELLRPKSEKKTTLAEMEKYINEKNGKPPNSFDVSTTKEYLRVLKIIEGNLPEGYWK